MHQYFFCKCSANSFWGVETLTKTLKVMLCQASGNIFGPFFLQCMFILERVYTYVCLFILEHVYTYVCLYKAVYKESGNGSDRKWSTGNAGFSISRKLQKLFFYFLWTLFFQSSLLTSLIVKNSFVLNVTKLLLALTVMSLVAAFFINKSAYRETRTFLPASILVTS